MSKPWIAIVATKDQGLYKVRVHAIEESDAKMFAHNIVMAKFKPAGIQSVIVQPWTEGLQRKIEAAKKEADFVDFMARTMEIIDIGDI